MSTAAEHPTFTDTTWATAAPRGYLGRDCRERVGGWMHSHDLAVEMAREGHMEFELCRLLVSAALNGMPVVIRYRGGGDVVLTETVVIRDLGSARGRDNRVEGHMHVEKWGGAHPIYYREIVAAGTPESVFEFDAHGKHHAITHPWHGEETHEIY